MSSTSPATSPWLLVGLGNPEAEYGGTRHNLGADAITLLAGRFGEVLRRSKQQAQVADLRSAGRRVLLARPDGYMNLSGGPVGLLARYHKVTPAQIVVVHDDIDLPEGRVQVRLGGGAGGHNGVKDIARVLGTRDFVRVKLGVGRPPGRQDPAAYVLERIPKHLQPEMDLLIERGADAALDLTELPLEQVQNRHHGA